MDKAVRPYDGCLAASYIDGEFTLKRVRIEPDKMLLVPANLKYKMIEVSSDNEFAVWGVVVWVIKKV